MSHGRGRGGRGAAGPSTRQVLSLALAALALLLMPALASPAAAADAEDADAAAAQPGDEPPRVGWLELSGAVREGPVPFAWVDEDDVEPSLREIVEQLEHVAESDAHLGVVVYLDRPRLELTQVTALAEAMQRVRAADKQVFTFAEEYDLPTYLLASSADAILLQHHGRVHLAGLAVEEFYVAGLLEKLGARVDLMLMGRFKGAGESLTRTGPSEAWNQNIERVLDDLYDQVLTRIAEGRPLDRDEIEAVMAASWTMSDEAYVEAGVVDRLTERDLEAALEPDFGERFAWDETLGRGDGEAQRPQQMQNPFALLRALFDESSVDATGPSLAVIHATGPVTNGESSRDGGPLATRTIGSRTMLENLARVRDDPMIRGALVRVNSPGGSAIASEVIWQAMRDLAEHKPVFVSIGPLAASGGYYLASGGDEIYLSPHSIVGSIGVVGGKLVLGDLYGKLDIEVHRRSRGPRADIFNSVEPFTEEQRSALEQRLARIYEQFTDRVEAGRGDRLDDIDAVAHGRVFTGREAVANGLADELGGLREAIAGLAARAELAPGTYQLVHLPPPMNLGEFLGGLFGVRADAPGAFAGLAAEAPLERTAWLELVRRGLGDEAWRAASGALRGLTLLRDEPVLTLMPHAIVIR